MKSTLFAPVIEHDVKTTGHRDDQLLQILVSVPSSFGPAWHIVQVINSGDIERNVPATFNKCKIAAQIGYARQINQSTVVKRRTHLSLALAGFP